MSQVRILPGLPTTLDCISFFMMFDKKGRCCGLFPSRVTPETGLNDISYANFAPYGRKSLGLQKAVTTLRMIVFPLFILPNDPSLRNDGIACPSSTVQTAVGGRPPRADR